MSETVRVREALDTADCCDTLEEARGVIRRLEAELAETNRMHIDSETNYRAAANRNVGLRIKASRAEAELAALKEQAVTVEVAELREQRDDCLGRCDNYRQDLTAHDATREEGLDRMIENVRQAWTPDERANGSIG